MNNFVGRKRELDILDREWNKEGFSFGAIYGRRRVGKTALIHEALKDKKTIYLQATKDRDYTLKRLSSLIGKTFFQSEDVVQYDSLSSALSVIAKEAQKTKIAFVIDEISYFAESDKESLSVLQSFVDNEFQDTEMLLILCGSNMSFMERDILGVNSPLYGRRNFSIKLMPFTLSESAKMLPERSSEEIIAAHIITGGIPLYLSYLKEHTDFYEGIREEFFSIGGRLYTEERLYLMTELRAVELYDRILEIIASGTNEVTQIADKAKKDKSSISQALTRLSEMGIVRKRKKILERGLDRGWVISDSYFAFYYRFVYPYRELIEFDESKHVFDKMIEELPAFIGRSIEKVFQKYVLKTSKLPISEIGNVEFPNPETKKNEEIDLVGVAGSTLIFGEAKWRKTETGMDVLEKLKRRSLLAFPLAERREYCILSKSEFSEDLIRYSKDNPDTIHLIRPEDLLK